MALLHRPIGAVSSPVTGTACLKSLAGAMRRRHYWFDVRRPARATKLLSTGRQRCGEVLPSFGPSHGSLRPVLQFYSSAQQAGQRRSELGVGTENEDSVACHTARVVPQLQGQR